MKMGMPPIILAIVIPLVLLGLFVLIDKFLNPIIYRRRFEKWSKERLKNNHKADSRILEKAEHGTLTPDETSLQIKGRKGEAVTIAWTDVEEIHAFKRDLFTVDLICIEFRLGENRIVEIHEEMVGYHDLQPWLQKKFPEIQANWFTTVAFPAFVTNYTMIWKKPISFGKTSS
jgi:hypothetical protein